MRSIDLSKEPWRSGAAFLAGLPVPPEDEDVLNARSAARRAARIILVENRLRRSRGQEPIDFMSVRDA